MSVPRSSTESTINSEGAGASVSANGVSQAAGQVSGEQHARKASLEGRTAFEIEAVSVMIVL